VRRSVELGRADLVEAGTVGELVLSPAEVLDVRVELAVPSPD
jgi:hypothetical protein